jgi:hypothetical protein
LFGPRLAASFSDGLQQLFFSFQFVNNKKVFSAKQKVADFVFLKPWIFLLMPEILCLHTDISFTDS